jgi:hypothetical protein
VLLLLMLTVGLLAAHAAAEGSTNASNERAARQEAPRVMATLTLPPGSTGAAADPSQLKALGQVPSEPVSPFLVDVHRFWRVPGDPKAALAWIQAHPPAGSSYDMSGAAGTPHGVTTIWDGYSFAPVRGVLVSRVLLVAAARGSGGGTALRADAQVVALAVRPAWERVPPGVKLVTITVQRLRAPAPAPLRVTDPNKVQKIATFVDALAVFNQALEPCPNDVGPFVKLQFRRASGGAPVATAVADPSGCGLVQFRRGSRTGPALAPAPRLINELSSLLRIRLG